MLSGQKRTNILWLALGHPVESLSAALLLNERLLSANIIELQCIMVV